MARLGLKIFYLRTRMRQLSQQAVAEAMGVRQATLSHVEQGVSLPSALLLIELCRFYDVTPTFLLDDDRGVLPLATERWQARNALVTTGMWVEVPAGEIEVLDGGKRLCPLLAGETFYDEEAVELRRRKRGARKQLAYLLDERKGAERALARALVGELKTHPRRRRKPGGGPAS